MVMPDGTAEIANPLILTSSIAETTPATAPVAAARAARRSFRSMVLSDLYLRIKTLTMSDVGVWAGGLGAGSGRVDVVRVGSGVGVGVGEEM